MAVALATALLAPGALAWYSYGSDEPDNPFDSSGGYMFPDLPGGANNRVYFNVFDGVGGGVSPNSATLGSRVAAPFDGFEAFLGVWIDCNRDGYVGMADGALREYRAEASAAAGFPVDATLCPSIADSAANAGTIHNSNGWVTEMLPIGASATTGGPISTDHRTIWDPLAKVWGDTGKPGIHEVTPGSEACTTLFADHQSRRTGGILQHLDCLDGNRLDGERQTLVDNDPTGGALSALPVPSTLYADGAPLDQPLPQAVAGEDSSQNSFVSGAQDCSQDPLVDTTQTTEPTPHPDHWGKSGVRPPGSPSVNPNGNVAGTVNETYEATPLDDCDTSDDSGHDYYGNLERPGSDRVTSSVYKTSAGFDFSFRPWNTRQGTAKNGCGTGATGAPCGAPADAGLPWLYTYAGVGDNMWDRTGGTGGPNVGGPSVDATKASLGLDPFFPGDWYTFYAVVSLSGLALPGSSAQYGAEDCTSGIGRNAPAEHGWACDPAEWNVIAGTTDHVSDYALLGNVGDTYNLRDVDCYDETLVVAGANLGGTGLNPTGQDLGGGTLNALGDGARCA